jgi:hypothetical protein
MSVADAEVNMALEGDIWLMQENEHIQKDLYKVVAGLVNDAQDPWVQGPAQMGEAFSNLCNFDSDKLVYRALIRVIKKRRYRYVRKAKIPRTSVPRDKDYWRSPWGKLLRNPSLKISGSYFYKQFRRRFRIPYELFNPLVEECEQHGIFDSIADCCVGTGRTKKIPIQFKILAALRMLGRDYYADDVAEILDCGKETARLWFLAFIRGVSKDMYDTYVCVPEGEVQAQ